MQVTTMSKDRPYHFNKSSLYAQIGVLDSEQVTLALETARSQCIEHLKTIIAGLKEENRLVDIAPYQLYLDHLSAALPEVNVVTDINGHTFGHAYIWTGCEELYNVLVGLEYSGAERLETIEDATWIKPAEMDWDHHDVSTHEARIAAIVQAEIEAADAVVHANWADDESPEEIEARVRERYQPKYLTNRLPPIVSLPGIEYTEAQMAKAIETLQTLSTPNRLLYAKSPQELRAVAEHLRQDPRAAKYLPEPKAWIAEQWDRIEKARAVYMGEAYIPLPTEWDPKWGSNPPVILPEGFEPSTIGYIKVDRSMVRDPDGDEDKSTLCCRRAPHWVTETMIREAFNKFNTERRLNRVIVRGQTQDVSYPQVRFQKDPSDRKDAWGQPSKIVLVCFSKLVPCDYDGLFALQMRKKVTFSKPAGLPPGHDEDGYPVDAVTLIFSCWRNAPAHHGPPSETPRGPRQVKVPPRQGLPPHHRP